MSRVFIAALLLAGATGSTMAQTADTGAPLPGWMAGCWLTEAGPGPRNEECWTVPRGTMMLGSGHMFDAQRSRSFEYMRIVRDKDGVAFIAQPDGKPPTRFTLDRQTASEVSFINAAHDYPQRVTYRAVAGKLEAEISLMDGSKAMRWSYSRAGTPTK